MRAKREILACTFIVALAGWLYFGTAYQLAHTWFGRQPDGYYGLLTAGFRSGHLYAAIDPHPALATLKNPYDAAANAPYRVHDMAYWKGRYYLYFGATPILIFFWPVSAWTGWYPTEPLAAAVFAFAGVCAGTAVLVAFRVKHCPAAPAWVAPAGALCLAFGNPVVILMQGPQFYQVAITCGFFLHMLVLGALYLALHSNRRGTLWLGAASLLYGLTLGARPNYLPGGVMLALASIFLAAAVSRRGERLSFGRLAGIAAAAFGPAAVCGAGLLLYNWQRFGSVTEFGAHYMLAGADQQTYVPFSLRNFAIDLPIYLFGRTSWSPYFPFFSPPSSWTLGLWRYTPWVWLAPCALVPLRTSGVEPAAARIGFAWIVFASALANLALLATLTGIENRYPCDFAPTWILAGGLGALALMDRLAAARWRRWVAPAVASIAVFTVLTGMAAFVARLPRLDSMTGLARACNWPAYAWERMTGRRQGALRLSVELPDRREGTSEPLFGTGRAPDQHDVAAIDYLPGNRARLEFFHAGLGSLPGDDFAIPPSRRIVVETRCGSLFPPFEYPIFSGMGRDAYDTASRDLIMTVDGVVRLRASIACYPSPPQDVSIGRVAWRVGGIGSRFTGRILQTERLPVAFDSPAAVAVHERLPIRLNVILPADQLVGSEPVVVTGTGRQSDLLHCDYDGRGRIHFGLDHFGMGGPRGETISYDPVQPHAITVWMGSLAGPSTPAAGPASVPWAERLVVKLDGRTALNVEQMFFPGDPDSVLFGVNAHGSTTTGPRFSGRVLSAETSGFESLPPLEPSGGYGPIEMKVQFPLYPPGVGEPLVVTGVSGAGDFVFVRYTDPSHIEFCFDHWGIGGINGAPIEIDYGRTHTVSIAMDSLLAPGSGSGLVRVTIDGKVALEGLSPCHPSKPRQIRIGENPIGGSTCSPAFSGRILSVTRAGGKPP